MPRAADLGTLLQRALLAQLVEHFHGKEGVTGSSPVEGLPHAFRPGWQDRCMEGRRSDARRNVEAIMLAAREALAEDPRTDLAVIATRAGVHRTTLYRHFPTREDLTDGLYEAYLDDAEVVIRDTDPKAEDLLGEIRTLTRRLYEVNIAWRAFAWAPAYSSEAQARRKEMTEANVALIQGLIDGP